MTSSPIVTIDGPSGSGKGTVSRLVAKHAGWNLLDSGALYRLVAVAGMNRGLDLNDVAAHASLAQSMDVDFRVSPDSGELICLEGRDVTAQVRSERGGQGASRVAAWPEIRAALMHRQHAFARPPGLVADGRDMGTVVFPAADLKIFLTASADARAQRRHKQLKDKESDVSLAGLSREIAERDLRDSTRAASPLKPAPDAHTIDSTGLTIEQVVERVLALGRSRALWN